MLALLQSSIGLEPVYVKTAYSALKQWQYNVNKNRETHDKKIGIVAFRNHTWAEWAAFAAHYIYNMGYQPVVIFSGREIASLYPRDRIMEKAGLDFWSAFLETEYIEKVDIDNFIPSDEKTKNGYSAFAEDHAHTMAAYNLRVEEYESHVMADEYRQEYQRSCKILVETAAAAEKLFSEITIERLICPSGLIGRSAAFLEAAARKNIKAVFVEGWAMRPGHMIWAYNRPALIYDIKGWMEALGEWNQQRENDSTIFRNFQEYLSLDRDDEWLEDFHPVQRSTKDEDYPADLRKFLSRPGPLFLCGTNVVGDSSTLRRAVAFKNQKEWLEKLIAYFKAHPDLRLIIRAHPDEVWQRARVKIGDYAAELARGIGNVQVVKGSDDVNTYSLVERADIGLAWLSNIGIDMIIRGKPVIMAASPKYDDLGIVDVPKTQEEYFKRIEQVLARPVPPSIDVINRAKYYQRIVFKEMSLRAAGKNYLTSEYRMNQRTVFNEREKFFRILVGELDEKGRKTA
ncbi:MAG: hypothetical protein A2509_04030 [Candidatus Edwardsbacteria bacterium RIFOXYD12_FULL_50_11]|uniref:Capsule biosynthesis protein n=1 Tax=Candidatus Edwardsbacteria bacterium GWF2_54_11 TaxID=1817851 RepID=A0A1F5R0W5_9BACT|nr:MAG: hypothetical protein A2502_05235 [Candidatus Edwardsbacteria bacterium RifOxyC12_full_54_24]OGF07860.1 MAG: hypothetical protein A2273_05190 [Candidatus Edwardsbacteria bacterium RifOxyA12_full_54_48]OGF08132.1 MAG: hypothetical protein A2024_08100 [Candidatus Edwardsbacteria bacterium GWF2_54_11]OGF10109.1 MAG: hypothetical protein A3K15_11605 [Candidatus Edwardsbacteria bacterium GWE2_54_12]OGF15020.1 MAG: hypothetical protein A2509_04030 [Candidatus Edwardsbacteria bacterium RIFOXYD1